MLTLAALHSCSTVAEAFAALSRLYAFSTLTLSLLDISKNVPDEMTLCWLLKAVCTCCQVEHTTFSEFSQTLFLLTV